MTKKKKITIAAIAVVAAFGAVVAGLNISDNIKYRKEQEERIAKEQEARENYVPLDYEYIEFTPASSLKTLPNTMLAPNSTWCKSTAPSSGAYSYDITEIEFSTNYTPTGEETEEWNADVYDMGTVKCYRIGTKVIVASNGEPIYANVDSSYMFNAADTALLDFAKLEKIENLQLLDTSYVESMRAMFMDTDTVDLDLSGFDTRNVSDMSLLFSQCDKLKSLDLASFNTEKVRSMAGMFDSCESLAELHIEHLDTNNVSDMRYMFANCSSLRYIDLSSFGTKAVTCMAKMFYGCTELKTLDLTGFDVSTVESMTEMFSAGKLGGKDGIAGNADIYVSDNWWENKTASKYNLFSEHGDGSIEEQESKYLKCASEKPAEPDETIVAVTMLPADTWYKGTVEKSSITEIEFSDNYTPSGEEDESWVADIQDTGDVKCYRIGSKIIIAGNGSGKICANEDSSYMFSSSVYGSEAYSSLREIKNISLLDTSHVKHMACMFGNCSSLESLDVTGFQTDKVTDMNGMFMGCESLSSLDLSDFETPNLETMAYMFSSCKKVQRLDLSGFDTKRVSSMNALFAGCSTLTEVNLSGINTANVKEFNMTFKDCASMETLDLSELNTDGATSAFKMFENCSALTSIDLSSFNTENIDSMTAMFSGCTALTELDLSSFDTSNAADMSYMFYGCKRLKTILVSENWTTQALREDELNSKGENMFAGCTELRGDITFSDSHTNEKYATVKNGYLTLVQ